MRQILGEWISDSEGEENSMQNRDDELIKYLTGKENVDIRKPKSKTKPVLKTIIKKIVKEKHKRARRKDDRKKNRKMIKVQAVIHTPRPIKSPEKLESPQPIPIPPGRQPPCPNRVEIAAGGPTARVIQGGLGLAFPAKESNLESTIGTLKLQLKSLRLKVDAHKLTKVMTSFPGIKSQAQLKELLLQEAEGEKWIWLRQRKDLCEE